MAQKKHFVLVWMVGSIQPPESLWLHLKWGSPDQSLAWFAPAQQVVVAKETPAEKLVTSGPPGPTESHTEWGS